MVVIALAYRCLAMITLPVLDSNQDNVDAVAVPRLSTLGIEQLLEDLVIGRKLDHAFDTQLVHPISKRIVDRLRRERRRDDEPVRRLSWAIRVS